MIGATGHGSTAVAAASDLVAAAVRSGDALAAPPAASLHTLLEGDPGSWAAGDWTRLAATLDQASDGPDATTAGVVIDGLPPFADAARRAADGHAAAGVRYVHAARLQARGIADSPGSMQGALLELVRRDPAAMDLPAWRDLGALYDLDRGQSLLPGPRLVDRTHVVALALAGARGDADAAVAQRFFDAWRSALRPTGAPRDSPAPAREPALVDVRAAAAAVLSRDPASLARTDWQHLQRALLVEGAGDAIPMTYGVTPEALARLIEPTVHDPALRRLPLLDEAVRQWQSYFGRSAAVRDAIRAAAQVDEPARLPPVERIAAVRRVLAQRDISATPASLDVLVLAREALQTLPVPAAGAETVRRLAHLLDVNVARMRGMEPGDDAAGLRWHPDYNEVGEIEVLLGTVEHLGRQVAPATPSA